MLIYVTSVVGLVNRSVTYNCNYSVTYLSFTMPNIPSPDHYHHNHRRRRLGYIITVTPVCAVRINTCKPLAHFIVATCFDLVRLTSEWDYQ